MASLHPNTVKFVSWIYLIATVWAVLTATLLLSARYIAALALALGPLILRRAATIWVHMCVFPYRNRVVSAHMARALDASGWLAWRGLLGRPVRILDFGCGMGDTASMLRGLLAEGVRGDDGSAAVDITSIDLYRSERWVGGPLTTRVVYDGVTLPFGDSDFDLAVAGQVLHHIPDNERSVREICRVATHALVVEDLVRRGTAQETFFHFWDSLWNWDFCGGRGTPHTNREHGEWLTLFAQCGMELRHFHATSFAFNQDYVTQDPAELRLLANGCYVFKKGHS